MVCNSVCLGLYGEYFHIGLMNVVRMIVLNTILILIASNEQVPSENGGGI